MDDEVQWPNQNPIVDGVVPTSEVSQDPHEFDFLTDEDLDREMED